MSQKITYELGKKEDEGCNKKKKYEIERVRFDWREVIVSRGNDITLLGRWEKISGSSGWVSFYLNLFVNFHFKFIWFSCIVSFRKFEKF